MADRFFRVEEERAAFLTHVVRAYSREDAEAHFAAHHGRVVDVLEDDSEVIREAVEVERCPCKFNSQCEACGGEGWREVPR